MGEQSADRPSLVVHNVEPIWAPDARVLILGTMPSPVSREVGIPYAHPQNRFWPVIAALFGEVDPKTAQGRRELARRHHLALFDVIKSCTIAGASDASIRDVVPQDIPAFVAGTQIRHVALTGGTALRYYKRLLADKVSLPYQGFPSTSPANASWRLPALIEAYAPIKAWAEGEEQAEACGCLGATDREV